MSKKKHSFTDKNGKRFVACCECERGGNGKHEHKCSCGWKIRRYRGEGCFVGLEIKEDEDEGRN